MYARQFSGYFVVLARNCLSSTLDYIAMQMRKLLYCILIITRRLAACTQAVVILRSTSYIAIELKCSVFEVVRIDVLKLFCLRLHFLESINSLLLVHGP